MEVKRLELSPASYILMGRIPEEVLNRMGGYEVLWALKPQTRTQVKVFNKTFDAPRWTANYLQSYTYSGTSHPARPLPAALSPLFDWANSLSIAANFNQALTNFYENGHHYIARHSDDEKHHFVPGSPIFSASFGHTRTFRIRNKFKGKIERNIPLIHGTYLIMCGNMQTEFTHEVPKISGEKGSNVGSRINVTFRCFGNK
jgi:alkylated DNA repair dioxygenase AlkB